LIGTPAKIASSMAGSPSWVPGILMKRLGGPHGVERLRRGESADRIVSQQGETSSDTIRPHRWSARESEGTYLPLLEIFHRQLKESDSPDLPSFNF